MFYLCMSLKRSKGVLTALWIITLGHIAHTVLIIYEASKCKEEDAQSFWIIYISVIYSVACLFHIGNIILLTKFLRDRDKIVLANKVEMPKRISEVGAIEMLQRVYIPV